MSTTINSTLPLSWDSSISYNKGDTVSYGNGVIYKSLVQGNLNHRPNSSPDYWEPLDIYKKDLTQMPHGDYSGDENIWQKDVVNIDTNGYLYLNNENTGINVKGQGSGIVEFDKLTPEQREQLRGPRGLQGEQGPAGPTGPEGPMGEVILTPEQIAALKGDQGKSTYQIWLDEGHVGTEEDFLQWLTTQSVSLDDELLSYSSNPVMNKAIYNAFKAYQIYINRVMSDYFSRLVALENRLKAPYGSEEYEFRFGITEEGAYGYYKDDRIIPFDTIIQDVLQTTSAFPGELVGASQFATQEVNNVSVTVANDDQDIEYTSFDGDVSTANDFDLESVLYSNNTQVMSFEDFADAKTYLYKNGLFIAILLEGYSLYNMTENSTNISSNQGASIAGVMFNPTIGDIGRTICLVVAPATEGQTVNYQIGLGYAGTEEHPEYDSSLPSVVNGTRRYSYTTGSFNTETTISYNIINGYKPYFASTSGAGYIIKQIYTE